jgi:hypothetical protein
MLAAKGEALYGIVVSTLERTKATVLQCQEMAACVEQRKKVKTQPTSTLI